MISPRESPQTRLSPHAGAIWGRSMESNGSTGQPIAIAPDGLYEKGEGINQIAAVIESLRVSPGSRRHIIEGWNVAELDRMALPPCHKTYQFHVAGEGEDARLNCLLYQRSCDVALGLPFNLWSAALLTRMVAQQVDMAPGELVWMGGDVHLYRNHAHLIEEQLAPCPAGPPQAGDHPQARNNIRLPDRRFCGS